MIGCVPVWNHQLERHFGHFAVNVILIVVCILCWGGWGVAEKMSLKYMSPLTAQLVGMYVYSALAPILFLYMKSTGMPVEMSTKGVAWGTLACMLSLTAGTAFLTAIKSTPVNLVVGITSIYPAITFLLCWLFLNEQMTLTKGVGIATVIVGTVLLAW